jgi:hypothetical protein
VGHMAVTSSVATTSRNPSMRRQARGEEEDDVEAGAQQNNDRFGGGLYSWMLSPRANAKRSTTSRSTTYSGLVCVVVRESGLLLAHDLHGLIRNPARRACLVTTHQREREKHTCDSAARPCSSSNLTYQHKSHAGDCRRSTRRQWS